MSGIYDPDPAAAPGEPWKTALLSQRDLSLTIPVNFVTIPGVSLSTACFNDGAYEAQAAARCLSNLLASGFRRFILDVYWDSGRLAWNFCPAQIPNSTSSDSSSSQTSSIAQTSISEFSSSSSISVSTVITEGHAVASPIDAVSRDIPGEALVRTQATPTSIRSSNSVSSTRIASSTTTRKSSSISVSSATDRNGTRTSSSNAVTPTSMPNGETAFIIGPYNCSTSLDLAFMVSVLSGYLGQSSNTLSAVTVYLTFNLHSAASHGNTRRPAEAPDDPSLPGPNNLLSNVLNTNVSTFLYTPHSLVRDRTNLNETWYSVPFRAQPDPQYYSTEVALGNVHTTPNGWPSESYIEFQKAERLMVEFGDVDPQMANYNFSGDDSTIFPHNYLFQSHSVRYAGNGSLAQGCFKGTSDRLDASTNNSWAISDIDLSKVTLNSKSPLTDFLPAINNLTACGSSPFLNTSLINETADNQFQSYRAIPLSTIWSWSAGEPRNVSPDEDDSNRIRCAVLDLSLQGHWRVEDCSNHHTAACRVGGSPYEWHLSSQKGSYSSVAEAGCGDNETFSAPRTGLENAYLHSKFLNSDHDSDMALWVNFNSLDEKDCWVVGVNSSCPYIDDSDAERTRTVVVPTVAAVIVFILAVLTLFVKCAANRQNSRRGRRRKGEDGWDYEGVPS